MANLYSRMGAIAHEDPEYGRFEPGGDGGFNFPDDLSDQLLRQHVRKKPMWEDEEMRAERMHQEAEQRHRDPAVLYAAVTELVHLSKQAQGAAVPADLAAELAELRKQLAELRGSLQDGTQEPAGEDPDGAAGEAEPAEKPGAKRKATAAKATAA